MSVERGRELEASGDVEGAVSAYVQARAASDAARVLAMQGRLEEAGFAILQALGVEASQVGTLPASERAIAEQAAAFFKSYQPELAADIREALANAPPPPPEPAAAESPTPTRDPAPPAAPPTPAPAAPAEESRAAATPTAAEPSSRPGPPASLTRPPARGPGVRPPAGAGSSFRPPVRGGGGESFRPPTTSGSFRPPTSGGFRPPTPGVIRRPTRPAAIAEEVVQPSRAPARPTTPSAPAQPAVSTSTPSPSAIASGSFTAPRVTRTAPTDTPSISSPRPAPSRGEPSRGEPARPTEPSRDEPGRVAPDRVEPDRVEPSPAPARPSPAPATAAPSAPPRRPTPGPSGPPPRASKRPAASGAGLSASGEKVSEYSGTRADGWRDADPEAIERSIQELLAGGRKGAAARIARDAGQTERALEWFQELGLHYQAGACLRELGRLEAAQQELLAVEVGSSNYRKACFELITVSEQLGRLDFDADRLLTQFVDEGPNDADEIESFLDLSRLYSLAGFASSARRCALKVVGLDPTHEEALKLAGEAREKAASRSVRPKPRVQSSGEGLPPLPTVDELIALAKQHAP